jgi:RNA polymerase sigma factor (sigma-70 family)
VADNQLVPLARHVCALARIRAIHEWTDRQLLEEFLANRDETAFAALIKRHGRLVLAVCHRALHHQHDEEDVFQATFLALARNAASIQKRASLGSWLHGVAYRLAMRAKRDASRWRRWQRSAAPVSPRNKPSDLAWSEVQVILDEEVQCLPEKYREVFVRCFMEDKNGAEVARELALKEGTVRSRLSLARKRLRQRLSRRGIALAALLSASAVTEGTIQAAVPAALAASTVQAALLFVATRTPVTELVSARVAALVEGAAKASLVTKPTAIVLLLLLTSIGAVSAVALAHRAPTEPAPQRSASPEKSGAEKVASQELVGNSNARTDIYGDPLPAGAIARLGTVRLRSGLRTQAEFSPDGKFIASAAAEAGVWLWDTATGKQLHQFVSEREVLQVAFSPDGKILAGGDNPIHIWEVATGKEIRRLEPETKPPVPSSVRVIFSPDGAMLASAGPGRCIRLWEVATGRQIRRLEGDVSPEAFSSDGKLLAATNWSGKILLWDLATGKETQIAGPGTEHWSMCCATFTPDSARLISCWSDKAVRVWDLSTHKQIRTLELKAPFKYGSMAISHNMKVIASGNEAGLIQLWETATGKELRRWQAHNNMVAPLAFSFDDKLVLSGGFFQDSALRVWDAATGKELHSFAGHCGLIEWLAFAPDGRSLFSAGREKVLSRWDLTRQSYQPLCEWRTRGWDRCAISPSRQTVATWGAGERTVQLWDAATGKEICSLGKYTWSSDRAVAPTLPLAFSPDGCLLASLDANLVRLNEALTGREIHRFERIEGQTCAVAFSPDSRTLAAASYRDVDGGTATISLWDPTTFKESGSITVQDHVDFLVFSPGGGLLAAKSSWGRIHLWDVIRRRELWPLEAQPKRLYQLAFSPDGKILAGSADRTIYLWEVMTGQLVAEIHGHTNITSAVAFSCDGKILTSGCADSTILLWDLAESVGNHSRAQGSDQAIDLEVRWAALAGGSASKAYQAVWEMTRMPEQAVLFLKTYLRPVPAPDRQKVDRYISELDDQHFAVRHKATKELEKLGELAGPALQKQLAKKPSLEMKRRINELLENLQGPIRAPNVVQSVRAVQVLEHIGTPMAVDLLRRLAQGAPEARLTQEAKASLERLVRQPAPVP